MKSKQALAQSQVKCMKHPSYTYKLSYTYTSNTSHGWANSCLSLADGCWCVSGHSLLALVLYLQPVQIAISVSSYPKVSNMCSIFCLLGACSVSMEQAPSRSAPPYIDHHIWCPHLYCASVTSCSGFYTFLTVLFSDVEICGHSFQNRRNLCSASINWQ